MSFTSNQFAGTRPYLFHLTARENLKYIRKDGCLKSAASLMHDASDSTFLRTKRPQSIQLKVGSRSISIRDQQPLYAGNVRLSGNFSFEDLIHALNQRVFFWPGKKEGPIDYGTRHFERYADDRPVILRISTPEMLNSNPDGPLYCRYNSGSPRCSKGLGSPRGPATFVNGETADFTPSKVVEVTFQHTATIPKNAMVADAITGPWRSL